jgi:hypothetical protein
MADTTKTAEISSYISRCPMTDLLNVIKKPRRKNGKIAATDFAPSPAFGVNLTAKFLVSIAA